MTWGRALFWTLVLLARSVGYQNARLRAFIADGAAWLWKIQAAFFIKAIPPSTAITRLQTARPPGSGVDAHPRPFMLAMSTEVSWVPSPYAIRLI